MASLEKLRRTYDGRSYDEVTVPKTASIVQSIQIRAQLKTVPKLR
ncbi:hypothetical protein Tco_0022962, partial [Tanacetum coccineum]